MRELVKHFIGSRDISANEHMEVQKIFQRHIDNAVSKTINLSHDYPVDEMSRAWLDYLPFLKGTTFYRENTRGYVDDQGIIHEPPLKALSLEEARSKFQTEKGVEDTKSLECPTGICDIK